MVKDASQPSQPGTTGSSAPQAQGTGQPAGNAVITHATAAWPLGLPVAMHVHLSTSPTGDVFTGKRRVKGEDKLPNFVWSNITLGDWNEKRVVEFEVNLPEVREI